MWRLFDSIFGTVEKLQWVRKLFDPERKSHTFADVFECNKKLVADD